MATYGAELFALCLSSLLAAAVSSDAGAVLFTEVGSVGAPAAYGHLTFSLSKDEISRRFMAKAGAVMAHFLQHRLPSHPCDAKDSKGQHKCHLHALPVNATFEHVYVGELRGLERAIGQVTQEMTEMIFGPGFDERQRRSVALAALAVFDVISFGLTIKNSMDIATFRRKMATVESRLDAVVHLDDGIIKTQVRDHAMIDKLINTTQR